MFDLQYVTCVFWCEQKQKYCPKIDIYDNNKAIFSKISTFENYQNYNTLIESDISP